MSQSRIQCRNCDVTFILADGSQKPVRCAHCGVKGRLVVQPQHWECHGCGTANGIPQTACQGCGVERHSRSAAPEGFDDGKPIVKRPKPDGNLHTIAGKRKYKTNKPLVSDGD